MVGVWEPDSRNLDSFFPNPYQNPDYDFVTTMNRGAIFEKRYIYLKPQEKPQALENSRIKKA